MTDSRNDENGFSRYEFPREIERGIAAAGFDEPRPIQVETFPAALEGRDVLGLAQTGTGKTAAFALPLLDHLLEHADPGPRALVIAPTRELANQIDAEIRLLAKFTQIKTATVFGGVSARAQVAALRRGPDVIVACPGRLLDLYGQRALRLDRIDTLVLDEADHMFDMGFLPDIERILKALPAERQNLLFSATMPREIRRLADKILHEPHVVELAHTVPAETIDHALYPVAEGRKRDLLQNILDSERLSSAIVFTRTKHRAKRLAQQLDKAGHRAVALQGNMSQAARDRAMRSFRTGRFDILVATDIAARGIDVTGVSHVVNFDVPTTPEAYTHRIGRTGRSEREGKACTFVTRDDGSMVRSIERMIGEPIARCEVPGFTEAEAAAGGRRPGANGRRSGGGQRANGRNDRSNGRNERPSGRNERPGGGGGRRRSRSSRGRSGRASSSR